MLSSKIPFIGASVGTVTHKQRLELKDQQEKTFTGLIAQILGIEIQKMPSQCLFWRFFRTNVRIF